MKSCLFYAPAFRWLASVLVSAAFAAAVRSQATPEGFGANTVGGNVTGTTVIHVDTLEDNPDNPVVNSFRWAVQQKYPRIVRFTVAGDIRLKARLVIKGEARANLTVDGSDAPGEGICIRGHEIAIQETNDIIVRSIRIRRGRENVTGFPRPPEAVGSSVGLDCVDIRDSENILFDHVSLSWSCDEIFGIKRVKNMTIQWCIMSEPLGDGKYMIHPYGGNHATGLNISASSVSIHHSLITNFRFRGPQFEANDLLDPEDVRLEAVNNVIFGYTSSGSRYNSSPDKEPPGAARGNAYLFHFVKNYYVSHNNSTSLRDIEVNTDRGPDSRVKVYVDGNIGPNRTSNLQPQTDGIFLKDGTPIASAAVGFRDQISATPLFAPAVPVTAQDVDATMITRILADAGCSHRRDGTDDRIVNNVISGIFDGTRSHPPE